MTSKGEIFDLGFTVVFRGDLWVGPQIICY